ncbi:MAG: GTPase HflX [Saprospiraceae bacterium]|jgi:GTP-binding protein HflX|nr:GTPase HflX [Saprospiraceae bacterium]
MNKDWDLNEKINPVGLVPQIERAVLVGVVQRNQTLPQVEEYLDELQFLALTAGAETVHRFIQKLDHPDNRSFVGKGKMEEIKQYVIEKDIDLLIFDDDLTGKQVNFLESTFKRKIVDRSTLILDIFAARAQTAQAKTQVELAQMQYLLPRLRGLWTHLERQRGGIGMRGPGEKEIETDRRIVRDKISLLKKKLETIDRQNTTQRQNRGNLIRVALVGYTNVGKSTLMTLLSKSEVFIENKLFATLDTTTRKVTFGSMPFLLSDTVGFIRKLPHHLVESFKSTLDETRESDILLHVVDVSHPQCFDQIVTVQLLLKELEVDQKPTLLVGNKYDQYCDQYFDALLDKETKEELTAEFKDKLVKSYGHEVVLISATQKDNIDVLKSTLEDMILQQYLIKYPYQAKEWG